MRYANDYVRRLLIERHHIYAKLLNPGGSIILNAKSRADSETGDGYSSMIGSSFHLDVMELDMALKQSGLKPQEIEALLTWVDGMTSQQAAVYISAKGSITSKTIQKRRERALNRLTRKMNDDGEETGMQSVRSEGNVPVRGVHDTGGRSESTGLQS